MKTYVITLSKQFPEGHICAGQPTYFAEEFLKGQGKYRAEIDEEFGMLLFSKIHTIRANYPLWKRRFAKIERGEACLSVRQWRGRPRHSKQVEIARLTKEDGIGLQKLEFVNGKLGLPRIGIVYQRKNELAVNDGLSLEDWLSWFKGYDLSEPMAIIHFTKFRY